MDVQAAAGGDGNVTPILITLYVLQLVFGIFVFMTQPKREELSPKVQSLRTLAIFVGLLPCFGFALAGQIIYFVLYRLALSRADAQDQAFRAGPRGFGDGPRREPPGGSTSKPSSDNPFL